MSSYNYAPHFTITLIAACTLFLAQCNSTRDAIVSNGSKIKIDNAVYQCVKTQELDLK